MKTLEQLFTELQDAHKVREDFIKTNTALTNQIKAIKRKHGSSRMSEEELSIIYVHFDQAKKEIGKPKKAYEDRMIELVKQMPHHDWITQFIGIQSISYASMLAEIGDLTNYENPAKVWKRMGLAVRDGKAEKNSTKGINTGYSKERRSIMFRVVNPVIQHSAKECRYTNMYKQRKQWEVERNENGENVEYIETHKMSLLHTFSSKENKEKIEQGRLPDAIVHLRAHRYVAKQLLKDLWMKWNKVEVEKMEVV